MAELLAKRVQDLVLAGEEPPRQYVCRVGDTTEELPSLPSVIPIVNLNALSRSTPCAQREQELHKLRSALSSWGCFQGVGHGISSSFLDTFRRLAKEFFALPNEEKSQRSKGVKEMEGYGADPVPAEGQPLDWSDRLFLHVYPEDGINLEYWPENPKSFRDALKEYTERIKELAELVSKAMARSLGLEESCFLTQFGERATLQARFNYYPACPKPDLILGLKSHADGTGYTIILQDDVEGLQILQHEKWITVPTIPHALLVVMGDQMEIMTNGVFKSPVHRVVTNSERERISVAVFYTPEAEKEIGPEDGLISEERPRLFKKVKNYADIHWEYYQQGMRALHTAKLNIEV